MFSSLSLQIPSFLWGTSLLVACLFNIFLLCWLYRLLSSAVPLQALAACLLALLVSSVLSPLATPGTSIASMLNLLLAAIILDLIVSDSRSGLKIWFFVSLVVVLSSSLHWSPIVVFWSAFSYSLGFSLHFFIIDRGHIPVRFRRSPLRTFFYGLGLFLLAIWALIMILQVDWKANELLPSSYVLVGPILAALCVLLAWLKPWKSKTWMVLAILCHGLLVSHTTETLVFLTGGWILINLLLELWAVLPKAFTEAIHQRASVISVSTIAAALALTSLLSAYQVKPHELSPRWYVALKKIGESSEGIWIVGKGEELFKSFYPGAVYSANSDLLQASEDAFLNSMKENSVQKILVDLEYLKDHWKQLIQDDIEPSKINSSVLARATVYQGREEKTDTLRLKPIEKFRLTFYESINFVELDIR